jgi:inorganic pyrophosphatase
MSPYTVRKIGAPNTFEHRVFIEKDGVPVSPFHDIPLFANEQQTILNMIVEIPRWTNGKLEVWLHFGLHATPHPAFTSS